MLRLKAAYCRLMLRVGSYGARAKRSGPGSACSAFLRRMFLCWLLLGLNWTAAPCKLDRCGPLTRLHFVFPETIHQRGLQIRSFQVVFPVHDPPQDVREVESFHTTVGDSFFGTALRELRAPKKPWLCQPCASSMRDQACRGVGLNSGSEGIQSCHEEDLGAWWQMESNLVNENPTSA